MYLRYLEKIIKNRIGSGKAIVLIGPRQVGKTTLIETILKGKDYLLLDGDDPKTFIETYKAESKVIDRNNFRKFVLIN